MLLEGRSVAEVIRKRGLKQGDPLSPYLSILVANVLSLVSVACDLNLLKGIRRMARRFLVLTHYFFPNDAPFFLRASMENCLEMRSILNVYCMSSSQDVNLDKSRLYFTANASDDVKDGVSQCLGIADQSAPSIYPGLPANWEKSKVSALKFVIEKVRKKMQGWKQRFLSQAGREFFIKAIVNAVPTYAMKCFKFPKRVCMELDSLISKFF